MQTRNMGEALPSHCPAQTIVQGIEATEIIPGRCEVIDEDQPFGCVVDAADTPAALSRLMDGLQECRPKRLILVLGSPGGADPAQRPFMGEIAHYKAGLSSIELTCFTGHGACRLSAGSLPVHRNDAAGVVPSCGDSSKALLTQCNLQAASTSGLRVPYLSCR